MRRLFPILLFASGFVATIIGFASSANAAAQRTFVASYGSPTNTSFNCSIAKPCRAFGEALGVTNSGGEVVVLDSAGYGPVTITKAVSIIAPPGVYAGVSVITGSGITINGPGTYVTLRGLTINGLGGDSGIDIQDAGRVRIENYVVSGMLHMGIFHRAAAGQVTVSDTIVRDNSEDGIRMVTSIASITLERVTIEGNLETGLYISPNEATGKLDATISDSRFARNASYGIWADAGANAQILASIDRSTVAENGGYGVHATGSSSAILRMTVQRSTIRKNVGAGILASGSSPAAVELNASDNVLHRDGGGIAVSGNGATVRASGNSYGVLTCQDGGTLVRYGNNSVITITGSPPCVLTLAPLM